MVYLTSDILDQITSPQRNIAPETFEAILLLAVEIAREGREGRRVGTIFVVGDVEEVLKRSKPLILDPLKGHPEKLKGVHDHDLRETVKELAQLDGAFIVSADGVVLSACRYLDASASDIRLPLGLGSRHVAAASVTRHTDAVAVVVSESSVVRLFDDGKMVAEIIPELWLLRHYGLPPGMGPVAGGAYLAAGGERGGAERRAAATPGE